MKARVDQKWMCVNIKFKKVDLVAYETLRWSRKESIAAMIKTESGRPYAYTWRQLRAYGWRCIKVYVSFEVPGITA